MNHRRKKFNHKGYAKAKAKARKGVHGGKILGLVLSGAIGNAIPFFAGLFRDSTVASSRAKKAGKSFRRKHGYR